MGLSRCPLLVVGGGGGVVVGSCVNYTICHYFDVSRHQGSSSGGREDSDMNTKEICTKHGALRPSAAYGRYLHTYDVLHDFNGYSVMHSTGEYY